MSKIDEYRRALDHCIVQGDQSDLSQIRELWMTIGRSYQFLIDREEREQALAENKPPELAASS
jgi:hypothetical protein